ncbi:MAG: isoprenylcysteine carboxylmethyltransferase family protein [Nocardia sp.]|nr:isoprenylcysteine carboxylmethyltransferase family protein [Nocardia sp.]
MVSPVVVLTLYVALGAFGIGWRSWKHRRSTGFSGFHGISGRPGSGEWFIGAGFVVSIALGVLAPIIQLIGAAAPIPALEATWLHVAGAAIAIAGLAAMIRAQAEMGASWRIGVDHEETTALVRAGIFRTMRNPIYTAMLVFTFGTCLIAPTPLAFIGFAALLADLELQVRIIEEPHLRAVHGDTYREYSRAAGRFLPRVGRI